MIREYTHCHLPGKWFRFIKTLQQAQRFSYFLQHLPHRHHKKKNNQDSATGELLAKKVTLYRKQPTSDALPCGKQFAGSVLPR